MGTFRSKSVALASVIVLVLQSLMPAIAQDRQLVKTNNSQKRVALVIGNAAYTKAKPLANPANDASDMAATLKGLGFEVVSGVNQNKRQIEALIRDFGTKLAASGGIGLFYYAGHGIQVGGENYLVPVDADIPEEDEVAYSAVPISLVLTKMSSAKNDLNIVILDACRNNPFARSWRGFRDSGNTDGLAKISPPTGTLVLYATEPGKVASDGTGRNGLFTESLLKQIKTPGLEYDQMVRALSTDVWERSGKQQLPWKEGNALQVFYFSGQGGLSKPSSDPVVTAKTEAQQEQQAWDLVKNSNDAGDLRLFLAEFPSGVNSAKANIRLEELVWQSAKAADTKEKVKAYLDEFPSGANAAAARIRLRQLEASATVTNPSTSTRTEAVKGQTRKSALGIELAWIAPGEFMMGSPDNESYRSDDEGPQHRVTIRNGFWMGRYEVTQGQWQAVMGDNPSNFKNCGADCPVEQVSWDDIQIFLKRLNSRDTEFEYRLPSEAEWEYAARAGTTTAFAFGDSLNSAQANFKGGKTVKVGNYQANAWGLYDMHGNVWEWVQDIYSSSYQSLPTDGSANESSGDKSSRVLRGGSWIDYGFFTRSAYRVRFEPTNRYNYLGFRLVARAR